MSRPLIPPSDGFAHRRPCVASLTLAALPRRSPGGQGGGAPDNLPTSTPLQTPQTTSVGGLCPLGVFRSPAPPARAAYQVPFCLSKMGHLRKPRVVSGTQRRKHRNGRPHRAAKIAPGLCLGAIPYLAPLRRNRAAVRRAKYMGLRGKAPEAHIFFMEGSLRGGPPVPLVFSFTPRTSSSA